MNTDHLLDAHLERNYAWRIMTIALLSGAALLAGKTFACCSLSPAHFSSTRGWIGEIRKDGHNVHILAYENAVENLATRNGRAVGNAMFLPIPAVPGSMSAANIIDTTSAPHILADMQTSWQSRPAPATDLGAAQKAAFPAVQVFEHGIYTIVLARHATDIGTVLTQVPLRKRPKINQKIFDAYNKWYPNWTFALCCFDTKEKKVSDPMLWWYLPQDPKHLFFPAVDCHTGQVPDLTTKVDVDHFLALSTDQPRKLQTSSAIPVSYTDHKINVNVKSLLPATIFGATFSGQMPQGDFVVDTDGVRAGNPQVERKLPPGAQR